MPFCSFDVPIVSRETIAFGQLYMIIDPIRLFEHCNSNANSTAFRIVGVVQAVDTLLVDIQPL